MLILHGAEAILRGDNTEAREDAAGTEGLETGGDLRIAAGRILAGSEAGDDTGFTAGADAADDADSTLDVSGCVITAGLVNAHHHLFQTAFRTLPGTRGVPMSQWLGVMAGAYAAAGMDPELFGLAARAGAAESLLCGVTTVADHHLSWPATASTADTVDLAHAIAGSARGLGLRLALVRGSARDDPQAAATSADAIARALVPDGAGGVLPGGVTADGMLQLAVGPAGVHSDTEETFRLLGEVAATHGLRRRTQAGEQVDDAVALERYGRRPLDLLEDWGWLAPDVTLAHLCGIRADEIDRIAASGASATHAPGCDLPMGWGVAPVEALRAAGVIVGLGTSGGGSNDAGHLLADARLALQVAPLAPLRPDAPPLTARSVLGMATEGSALGLGRADIGHLRPGARADLCVWDVSGVADAGVADPVAGLLWASPGRRPRHVIVGGKVVVRDGRLVQGDEAEITAELRARVGR